MVGEDQQLLMFHTVQVLSTLNNVEPSRPAPAGHHGQHPAEHHLLDHPEQPGTETVWRREQDHPANVAGNADHVASQHPQCPEMFNINYKINIFVFHTLKYILIFPSLTSRLTIVYYLVSEFWFPPLWCSIGLYLLLILIIFLIIICLSFELWNFNALKLVSYFHSLHFKEWIIMSIS